MDPDILLQALGGSGNVKSVEARSSRLLLDVVSVDRFDDEALAGLGVRGLVRIAPTSAHVILGPIAVAMEHEMSDRLAIIFKDKEAIA
jgi:N-acetylglucosamine PTS system EIICBA or EIICB component